KVRAHLAKKQHKIFPKNIDLPLLSLSCSLVTAPPKFIFPLISFPLSGFSPSSLVGSVLDAKFESHNIHYTDRTVFPHRRGATAVPPPPRRFCPPTAVSFLSPHRHVVSIPPLFGLTNFDCLSFFAAIVINKFIDFLYHIIELFGFKLGPPQPSHGVGLLYFIAFSLLRSSIFCLDFHCWRKNEDDDDEKPRFKKIVFALSPFPLLTFFIDHYHQSLEAHYSL
ncbi:hypothetical protein SOVF_052640 isoform A, partial [Spinacia oleracea]